MNRLTVHHELARHFARHKRLYRGGVYALASQVVLLPLAWVVGPTWLALAGTVMAFIAGLLWPLASQEPRARAAIREQIGYVYDTALSHRTAEPFGFWSEVEREARYRERAVIPPELPQWWVPLLLTALLLAAIPLAVSLRPAATEQFASTSPNAPETTVVPDEAEQPATPEPEPADPRTAEPPAPPEGPGTLATPQESRAAIDDFLADLAYAPDDAPLSDETGTLGEALEQYEQLADDTAYTELEAAPGDEQAEQPEETTEGGVAELDEADEELAEGMLTAEPGQGDGDTGNEQGMQEAAADDELGLSPGDDNDPGGAGDAAGTPQYADNNERLTGTDSDPEFLGGITDGTMERSGSVRVQGEHDISRVQGRALSEYAEAIEEELLGGSLPVPYQETVRKFFQ